MTVTLLSCKKICSVTTILCNDKVEEPAPVDFTQIDEFPKFEDCKEILNFEESKMCFETILHTKIAERVQNLRLKADQTITDTIILHFSIDNGGRFVCTKVKASDSIKIALPNLTVEIKEIIHGLAPVSPAQKRGIPVKSTYNIPLVIKTE